jgi:FkbM family methyltransferase
LNALRRLSHNPRFTRVARRLGLRRPLRALYFTLARPRGGFLEIAVAGVSAKFYVRNPAELRNLEPAGDIQGEIWILGELVAELAAGGTFYDVGANVGLYSILLAKTMKEKGSAVAFEPMGEAFDHLQDNLALNGVENVRAFRVALGEERKEGELFLGEGNADSSLAGPRGKNAKRREKVRLEAGDAFMRERGLPLPTAVKIDVEGYELAVIKGLWETLSSRACRVLCCEIHPYLLPRPQTLDVVLQEIRSLGFSHLEVRPRKDTFHAIAKRA